MHFRQTILRRSQVTAYKNQAVSASQGADLVVMSFEGRTKQNLYIHIPASSNLVYDVKIQFYHVKEQLYRNKSSAASL
jgi:hypothetical protein